MFATQDSENLERYKISCRLTWKNYHSVLAAQKHSKLIAWFHFSQEFYENFLVEKGLFSNPNLTIRKSCMRLNLVVNLLLCPVLHRVLAEKKGLLAYNW